MFSDPSIQAFLGNIFRSVPRVQHSRPKRRCDVCQSLMSPVPLSVNQYAYYELDRKYGNTFRWKCVCCDPCATDYEDRNLPRRYPTLEAGHVYLMHAPCGYKIGESGDPEARRVQKERDIRQPVELLHTIKAPHKIGAEKYFQYRYGHLRINIGNNEREWFNLSQQDVDYIKSFTEIEAWRPYFKTNRVIVRLPFREMLT